MSAWTTTALGNVATIDRDTVDASLIEDGALYVGLENIKSGGELVDIVPVGRGDLASGKFRFTRAHVLFGKLRPYLAKVARPDFDGICSTDILPVRPGPSLDRDYLAHFLVRPESVAWATSRSTGANLPRLSPGALTQMAVPLPPLDEQRRIAALLDRADGLRARRRASLADLDNLIKSVYLHMFGDPILNPRGWPTKKFGDPDVGVLDRGVSRHRPRNAPELLGGPYPLVQTGEVANCDGYIRSYAATYSEAGLSQSKMWPAGTLCITIAANIAKTGILTFDACFPDSVVGFRSNDAATVEYVRLWLSFLQKRLEDSAPESAQKNINLAILRDLDITFPPLALQQVFADKVVAIESTKAAMRSSLAELDAFFASLQDRAFVGSL